MKHGSYIRGIGLVGAQGGDPDSVWQTLLDGAALDAHRGAPLAPNDQTRVTQLAQHAATQALAQAGWDADELRSHRTALVIGTSKGPIERWIAEITGDVAPQPLIGVADVANDLGLAFQMVGPRLTLAAACASGLHALVRADLLLRSGHADRALVVGCESSLHPLFLATFNRMGVLSKTLRCAPFDQSRDGFLMSEAAAAVCLDREGPIAIDAGLVLSDAHHITGIDPAGEALRYLLSRLGDADLVHAHGTGTDANDPVELAAIDDLLGATHPSVYSHKAALGHTQGASGMIGVVLNVLAHRYNVVPPNANTHDPIRAQRANVRDTITERRIDRSIVLAAGFGGAIAGVALRSV